MRLSRAAAVAAAGMAWAGGAFAQAPPVGDPAKGKAVFSQSCMICHTAEAGGANGAGPALHGVFGRAAAKAPNFGYSAKLKGAGITWTATKLDAWIADAPKFLPGTLMAAPPMTDAQARADVIAYLKSQS